MWLLSTDRAELQFFSDPEDVPGGYAILSHVWYENEQQFQSVRNINEQCQINGENPRDLVSEKIRQACIIAEEHHHQWIWVDTCCIDKTSSAELSEAINSMYRYYSLSQVCYAFLEDVPFEGHPLTVEVPAGIHIRLYGQIVISFLASVWHLRGWTLQELIAPKLVIFISSNWKIIGSKADLAGEVEAATGVPRSVLTHERAPSDFSIAQRMSWASRRKTTRLEDEAYSLMGLFDINMPTIYGEGQKAFYRLQEEIMRHSVDTSLFAWGIDPMYYHSPGYCLLAPSPRSFKGCGNIEFRLDSPSTLRSGALALTSKSVSIPTFSMTSYGVLAEMPVLEIEEDGTCAGLLFSSVADKDGSIQSLGLVFTYVPDPPDPNRPLCAFPGGFTCRIIHISRVLDNVKSPRLEWRRIYFHARPAVQLVPSGLTKSFYQRAKQLGGHVSAPFRVHERSFDEVISACRLRAVSARAEQTACGVWTDMHPMYFDVYGMNTGPAFTVVLGVCTGTKTDISNTMATTLKDSITLLEVHQWARVIPKRSSERGVPHIDLPEAQHDCAEHHIARWNEHVKVFLVPFAAVVIGDSRKQCVELVFETCPMNARGTTLVLRHVRFYRRSPEDTSSTP